MLNVAAPMYVDNELVLPLLALTVIAFVILSFIIVLVISSVPNRLLLLGLLAMITSIFINAILPQIFRLTLVTSICGGLITFAGLLCTIAIWLIEILRKSPGARPTDDA